ncbi:MAG: hypothetical protein KUG81_08175 [Gammaproteobacteria bacterium]|nr:hypothetical protein [Gammaproteobacteria bacterium]
MLGFIDWVRSWFAWRVVSRSGGGWKYYENGVTGDRSAGWCGGINSPVDRGWLLKAKGRAWADGKNDRIWLKEQRT